MDETPCKETLGRFAGVVETRLSGFREEGVLVVIKSLSTPLERPRDERPLHINIFLLQRLCQSGTGR